MEKEEIEGLTAGILIYGKREQGHSSGERRGVFLGFTARLLLDVNNTIFPILPTTSAWKVFSTRKGMGNDISERAALALLRVHGTHYEHALLGFIARLGGRGLYIFLLSGCPNRETKKDIQTDSTKSDYRPANTRFLDIIALLEAVRVGAQQ